LAQNALENVENKILEVLDMVGEKVRRIYIIISHADDRAILL
jgi:hypothetical protein